MVFSSAVFLFLFLPAVFLLYRLMPGMRSKNLLLLLCSLGFYAFGEPVYVLLLLLSVAINYCGGLLLATEKGKARLTVGIVVALNLLLLGVFKYTDFLLGTVNRLFSLSIPLPGIALPIGISFFTFQGLSYVVDVYRDRSLATRSFLKLALYISFFPQLIAGPIVKYHDVSRQIDQRETSLTLTADGVRRFILGLSKKLLISNTVGQMADLVFSASPGQVDIRSAWIGAVCYCLQIYFDFSGYSDMAIGLGRMFGFRFLENFDHPYASSSIREFWRRWHISLSSWFRDYLYIPLGGNRKGRLRTELNKCLVFFCTGLWHGASWNFVLWGLWHGAFLILEDLLPKKANSRPGLPVRFLRRVGTLLIVLLGFVLFRADTLSQAGQIYSQMFAGAAFTLQSAALLRQLCTPYSLFITAVGLLFSLPLLTLLKARVAKMSSSVQKVLDCLSYISAGLLYLLCLMDLAGSQFNPFIYFRF